MYKQLSINRTPHGCMHATMLITMHAPSVGNVNVRANMSLEGSVSRTFADMVRTLLSTLGMNTRAFETKTGRRRDSISSCRAITGCHGYITGKGSTRVRSFGEKGRRRCEIVGGGAPATSTAFHRQRPFKDRVPQRRKPQSYRERMAASTRTRFKEKRMLRGGVEETWWYGNSSKYR